MRDTETAKLIREEAVDDPLLADGGGFLAGRQAACLPACLLACLPACLLACLPARLLLR